MNKLDKELLVQLFLGLQDQVGVLTQQTQELDDKMQRMMEQIMRVNRRQFGRFSEKMEDTAQICFMEVDENIVFFNEAEAVCDLEAAESDAWNRNQPSKKATDLSNLKVNRIDHYLSQEELEAELGVDGWKQLPDAIARRYRFIPATVEVDEHMVKAPCPKPLLHGSLVSPTLAGAIINGKYVNAVPLYRLEKEFERYGLAITRQNMANWMIRLADEYLFRL